MKEFGKWGGGVLAAVISGLLIYWLTVGLAKDDGSEAKGNSTTPTPEATQPVTDPPTDPTTDPAQPLSFLDRLRGDWKLQSWTEEGGPTTLNIEVSGGTLTVNGNGQVDWRLAFDERRESHQPKPEIKCGGQTTLDGRIEGVPGGGRNSAINWTSDLSSIDHSSTGEGWIWRALCGWATVGTRAPYQVKLDDPDTRPATAMEMGNQYGTFRWSRG